MARSRLRGPPESRDPFSVLSGEIPSLAVMRASTVRLVAAFVLLFGLALVTHVVGPGPDGPAPTTHHATTR